MLTKGSYTAASEGEIMGKYLKRGAKVEMTEDEAKYYLLEGRVVAAKTPEPKKPDARRTEQKAEGKASE